MMDMEENQPTGTIELEGGMMSLIANVSRDVKVLGDDEEDRTVELEQGLGSLLAGMSPAAPSSAASAASAASHNSTDGTSFTTRNSPGTEQSFDIVSPSTPASSTEHNAAPVTTLPSARKTPVPQPVTLATIAQALQMGNALDLKVLNYAQLGKLIAEFGEMIPDVSTSDGGDAILQQQQESIVKVALLLKDRCMELHTKLKSGSFRIGLQKLARIFSNYDTQTTEDMSRAAAIFMAIARAEARVDWAGQATEIARVSAEALAHSTAVVRLTLLFEDLLVLLLLLLLLLTLFLLLFFPLFLSPTKK